ncbi:hypothetical protein EC07798_2522 [Escherichia coli 07798]|nr:hypothetical protein EcoM_04482 [Escherichia coli WV_060327]EKI27560.1 hypothetical protein ECARS42123_2360 [Escherichia coli ARS4.2123]EKI40570.1 hypothetical protein EC07798_2522 [Escherichia coli 07798]KDZ50356.1 hypothetical protein AB16_2941 [Escherichia coli 3-073-06_S1_C1]KEL49020.1 hypothetical protein AB22_3426 [Escherichia coli 6-175-07_S1_C1]
MNGSVINTLRLVNHHRKPAFGAKQYSPKMIIVTPNAIHAELFGK